MRDLLLVVPSVARGTNQIAQLLDSHFSQGIVYRYGITVKMRSSVLIAFCKRPLNGAVLQMRLQKPRSQQEWHKLGQGKCDVN